MAENQIVAFNKLDRNEKLALINIAANILSLTPPTVTKNDDLLDRVISFAEGEFPCKWLLGSAQKTN